MALDPVELESLARRTPLVYGVTYIDLGQGREWEVETRAWIKEIYASVNPYYIEKNPVGKARRLVVQKPTQVGMSIMGIVKLLHFADYWPVRVMYTLPRISDVSDFTTTRLDPMIQSSERLKKKLGEPNSVHAKRLGDSYIYIMEMTVEPRSLPGDALFIDEVDLSDVKNIGTAMNRLDASPWKLNYFFSTPTLPQFGINSMYNSSDMKQWYVKCEACGHWQVMDWDQNLRVVGRHDRPSRVYYACAKCDEEITLDTVQKGEWVPEYPERSSEAVGFHVSQMMTHPAPVLYAAYRDPQTTTVEFYRKRLGKPFEIEGGSIDRGDILSASFDEPYQAEDTHDNHSVYYMGVDQGNELQVIVAKLPKNSRRPKNVHVEIVPFSEGFNRIGQLMKIFKIRRAVIDADPNRHAVANLQNDFPGKVIMADYAEQKTRYVPKKHNKKPYYTHVVIDRTAGFDHLMETIKDGGFPLPGDPSNLDSDVELLIDHITALKRDVETRRTASGEKQVGVWKNLRADHLAHAAVYLHVAIDIDRGSGFRVAVITEKPPDEEGQEQVDEKKPKQEDLVGIIALLAEVPKDQLRNYLGRYNSSDYQPPFPLSYKLGKASARYKEDDILWTITFMLEQSV